MQITVNDALKAYIDPLTPDEYQALERSLLAEGCRDALVLWGDLLIDGHNRYAICQAHGLPFQTVQNTQFKNLEDVHLWMIDQHLGRRSVSDFQRGVLALRKRQIIQERRARASEPTHPQTDGAATSTTDSGPPWDESDAPARPGVPDVPLASREDMAKAARLSNSQMVMIEKIQKQAAPELVAAIKSGAISINAAAAVATLPAEDQVAAATAGKDELKQAAKRVRDAKRKPRAAGDEPASDQDAADATPDGSPTERIAALQKRVAHLQAENDALRKQVLNLLAKQAPLQP